MARSKREDEYIGPSRGAIGLFHKFMMILLFPLRKPLWFLLIIFILFNVIICLNYYVRIIMHQMIIL